jgi:hypothetical protein
VGYDSINGKETFVSSFGVQLRRLDFKERGDEAGTKPGENMGHRMDASRGSHPILLAQPVRRASDSVARSAVV